MPKNDPRPSSSKQARMETRSKSKKRAEESSKTSMKRRKLTDMDAPTENDIIVTVTDSIVKLEAGENPGVVIKEEQEAPSQPDPEVVSDSAEVKVENSDVEEVRFVTEEFDIEPQSLKETTVEESGHIHNEYVSVKAKDLLSLREEIDKLKELQQTQWKQSRLEIQALNDKVARLEQKLGSSIGDPLVDKEPPTSLPEGHDSSSPNPRPDEQFSQVIENLDEGQAGQLTNDLVGEENVLVLFGKALKILINHRLQSNRDWRQLWPFLASSRLVCESWKNSVDRVLQDHPSNYELRDRDLTFADYKSQMTPNSVEMKFADTEKTSEDIDHFTQMFKRQQSLNPLCNPIPTRRLHIVIKSSPRLRNSGENIFPMDEWTKFSQNVTNYLQAFGKQVWHLSLDCYSVEEEMFTVTLFKSIFHWLRLLPNLKSFAYYVNPSAFEELTREIEPNVEDFSIPHWTNLVTFQSEAYYCPLDYFVLRNNQHIQKLRLTFVDPDIFVQRIKLDLAELSFHRLTMENMINLASCAWKFRKLTLSLTPVERFSVDYLATTLGKYASNLESLTLDLSYLNFFLNLGETVLRLPSLKKLHLIHTVLDTVLWENFLKELKQLETLELELGGLTHAKMTPTVWEDIKRARQPSFWCNFPKIRSVCFNIDPNGPGIRKHTRELIIRDGLPQLIFDVKCVEKIKQRECC